MQFQVPMGEGPVAVKRIGNELLIAVCTPIELRGIEADVRDDESPWSTFWVADASVSLQRGDVISATQFTTQSGDPSGAQLDGRSDLDLSILLRGVDKNENLLGVFLVEPELSEDAWLHADGTRTEQPCEQ